MTSPGPHLQILSHQGLGFNIGNVLKHVFSLLQKGLQKEA